MAVARVFPDAAMDVAFDRAGYVCRPFIGPERIERMMQLHESLASDVPTDAYSTVQSASFDLRWRVSEGIREILGTTLDEVFPHHRLSFAAFVTKRASTRAGTWPLHQDWWIVDNSIRRAVHAWCPLVDVDEENGCLRVVPCSQALLSHPYPINPKYRTEYHGAREVLDREFATAVPMPAGQTLVYDQRLLHGSGENRSGGVRAAFNCVMVPRDVSARLYWWDEKHHDRFDVLEVSDRFLCEFQYGGRIDAPYPPGVRLLEHVKVPALQTFGPEDFTRLRRLQAEASAVAVPAE